jgi:hypothetical protein
MNIELHSVDELPIIVIEDCFENLNVAYKELYFLSNSSHHVHLEKVFSDLTCSSIFKELSKVLTSENLEKFSQKHPLFYMLERVNQTKTEINFVKSQQFLQLQNSNSVFTLFGWIKDEILGSDIILNQEVAIEAKHNRFLIFPSVFCYETTKLESQDSAIIIQDLYVSN